MSEYKGKKHGKKRHVGTDRLMHSHVVATSEHMTEGSHIKGFFVGDGCARSMHELQNSLHKSTGRHKIYF